MAEMATIRQTARRAKAEGLGVSETALRRWTKSGELPSSKVGNRHYVSWAALKRYLGVEQQQVKEG